MQHSCAPARIHLVSCAHKSRCHYGPGDHILGLLASSQARATRYLFIPRTFRRDDLCLSVRPSASDTLAQSSTPIHALQLTTVTMPVSNQVPPPDPGSLLGHRTHYPLALGSYVYVCASSRHFRGLSRAVFAGRERCGVLCVFGWGELMALVHYHEVLVVDPVSMLCGGRC